MRKVLYLILLTFSVLSCTKPKYTIAISQCNQSSWRRQMNQELQMSTYFHDGVELSITSAENDWKLQERQVDSMIQANVSLIVLAPIASKKLVPVVDRAMAAGIPVLIFDRELDSDNYTAYIGADNEEIGNELGRFIVNHCDGKANIVEISGQALSSPAIQRHEGLMKAVKSYPDIHVTTSIPNLWTVESGYRAMDSLIHLGITNIDYVFAHNDRLALGAYNALCAHHLSDSVKICGIDGLPGPEGGIDMVDNGSMLATSLYPTKGNIIMQLALNILDGKPFKKENTLKSGLITKANTSVMKLQIEALNEEQQQIQLLNSKIVDDIQRAAREKFIYTNIILGLALIILFLIYQFRVHSLKQSRETLNRLVIQGTVDSINQNGAAVATDSKDDSSPAATVPVTEVSPLDNNPSDTFANSLRAAIMRNYSDSEFNVDSLATELNLSRAQLYRKTKNLCGQSPVELLRDIRLQQAVHLLSTTDKTVSEIAYNVGFSAPAYFSKCYKDRYGQSPREKK